ncbi:MAG: Rid family hydrolase [Acidimicrobiia bacterium]|nr:Rid family hydrolase [Acidimicrobiia bacterium]
MIEVHATTPRLEAAMARYGIKNSTAIRVDNTIFFSGMTGLDLETGAAVEGGTGAQARHCLGIFAEILGDLGLSLDHVVKVNAQLADIDDFAEWNEVFLDVFDAPYPCRTTTGAPLVVGDIEIEISASIEPRR